MRYALVLATLLALGGCITAVGPKLNEATGREGRRVQFRVKVAKAVFCEKCGERGEVQVILGEPAKLGIYIPNCYAHAKSKLGDNDKLRVELLPEGTAPAEALLEIADCTTQHLTATLTGKTADGLLLEAKLDTDLTRP